MSSRFVYDEVSYDTEANPETHPASIATLARLAGLSPAPPSSARVLEIGCGNGENLLSAATYLPRASFVGFDLAETAIASGVSSVKDSAIENVTLRVGDLRDVHASKQYARASGDRGFDYVVAHGMYSWVPEPVRADLLGLMHDALGPNGVGFLSINCLPGWELRRALRELALDRTAGIDDAATKVAATLRLVEELKTAGAGAPGFRHVLAAAAGEYAEAVASAKPPEAPFSRDVFHDLLAEVNDPFTVAELEDRLARAGLRLVCETPLRPSRADEGRPFEGLAADITRTGVPFLQVLVQRDDAALPAKPLDPRVIGELFFWADFNATGERTYRTTKGWDVTLKEEADAIARAVPFAPGFVRVADLEADEAARQRVCHEFFRGFVHGAHDLVVEAPAVWTAGAERPRLARHVATRAATAVTAGRGSVVLTNALHQSFRVKWDELFVLRHLDGEHSAEAIAEIMRRGASQGTGHLTHTLANGGRELTEKFVRHVIEKFRRHLFFVGDGR